MLVLNEDQKLFKDVVVRFFADQSSPSEVRKLMDTSSGYDADVWQMLSEDLGLPGLHIPEQFGGFGFGMTELGLVLEQMGRNLYCGPYFASSVMAGYGLLMAANESAKTQYLPSLSDGSMIASLVVDDLNKPDGWGGNLRFASGALTGTAELVLDAGVAQRLWVIAKDEQGQLGFYDLEAQTNGVLIESREAVDPTRKLYRVTFTAAKADPIGTLDQSVVQSLWDRWSLCLAHEMLGGAQFLLDGTVEYTKLRYQFGRPIGSFQGLKHRCAELLMELELAKGVVAEATVAAEKELTGPSYLPNMAKAMASDAYMSIAKAAVQLRGGIGFTWENDTHLWFKRAKSSEVFLGTPAYHRERIIQVVEEEHDAA